MANPICLGLWQLSGHRFGKVTSDEAKSILDSAVRMGYYQFDTAYFYGNGQSYRYLAWLTGHIDRAQLMITGKGGLCFDGNRVIKNGTRVQLREDLMKSLDLLNSDYLDCYYLHWPDPAIDLEESLEALTVFKKEGLIRSFGVCNLIPSELKIALKFSDSLRCQVRFNPLHQAALLDDERVLYQAYSPFEQGLLLSDYPNLGKKDFRRSNDYFGTDHLALLRDQLYGQAERDGLPASIWILKHILSHRMIDQVVVGLKRTELLTTMRQWI